MRILRISDTHGQHRAFDQLPEADIIVHSGDFTFSGTENEAFDFINWFCDLPFRYKIFIAGNHDDCMYGAEGIEGLPENVYYLCNSGVEIEGLHFYGIPMFMQDFMDGVYPIFYKNIPENTDVLITHQPPRGVFDSCNNKSGTIRYGDADLMDRVRELHLKTHLFGHQHECNGMVERNGVIFSNAAVLDNKYKVISSGGARLITS